MEDVKLVNIAEKRRKILKLNLMKLKLTVRSKMSETGIVISVTLRRVTSLELI